MKIELNRFGAIEEGDNQGWRVYIEDDRSNTEGYLILVSPYLESSKLGGYDHWVDSASSLQKYFEEANWKVKWEGGT